jgi:hypothetical protein
MSAHSDNRAEDFVPGLYPLKVGAIATINRALGIIAHKPQQAPRVKEYAPDSGNRVDGQSGAANAIVAHTPPPQIEIDHSPLTDDEIAYGQRIADDPAVWDAPGIPLETVLAKRESGADLVSPSDRGVVSGVGKPVNVTVDTDLEIVGGDAGKSGAPTIADDSVLPLPEGNRGEGGKSEYPRFHPMKGFSKIQRRIWHWLDEHAAEVNHKYPTQRDVAEAVGTTHPTAGKYLQQWRNHNGITKPEFYQDQAS